MAASRKQLVVVGDVEASETRLPSVCSDGELAEDSASTVFENYVNTTEVRLGVALWDTAGRRTMTGCDLRGTATETWS
ncbi:hypothetical protein HPB52_016027 [Rhipicephalus sanguineus]|uniref:Uncharacterized protein n=1 Tax=Rhipicephalus sanguineus TaxID=34632 RepID=A0A9D4TAV3_RHISA|nr:hypothetical protein HPB52_016027 [Rhipicephalus sanguineus]